MLFARDIVHVEGGEVLRILVVYFFLNFERRVGGVEEEGRESGGREGEV